MKRPTSIAAAGSTGAAPRRRHRHRGGAPASGLGVSGRIGNLGNRGPRHRRFGRDRLVRAPAARGRVDWERPSPCSVPAAASVSGVVAAGGSGRPGGSGEFLLVGTASATVAPPLIQRTSGWVLSKGPIARKITAPIRKAAANVPRKGQMLCAGRRAGSRGLPLGPAPAGRPLAAAGIGGESDSCALAAALPGWPSAIDLVAQLLGHFGRLAEHSVRIWWHAAASARCRSDSRQIRSKSPTRSCGSVLSRYSATVLASLPIPLPSTLGASMRTFLLTVRIRWTRS